jgi:nitroimidazol reductase NimA-like FMN-containing flavoprotein (pyridoxamine 5'-phosphate oxidase superfamily)
MASVPREMLELSRPECLELLGSGDFGRVAVAGGGQAPIIRPVNYVFDRATQSVVFRTAPGSKFHSLIRATHAAFEVDSVDGRTRTGWSVIVVGVTEEIVVPAEVRRLGELGLEPWVPGDQHHWVRIRARTVSGRRIELV